MAGRGMKLRTGSLCKGYGGLELAAEMVLGPLDHLWYAEHDPATSKSGKPVPQYAAQVCAAHWPDVPNLGDLTAIDWTTVPPVDVLTAGFPCTDVSAAGKRAGLKPGTRTGIWSHIAHGIGVLKPRLVLLENVEGLLSGPAHSDVEPCPWCLGDTPPDLVVRALGAVLADLAALGFDAEWATVPASDVGAPHRRRRVFIVAWPAGNPPHALGLAGRVGVDAAGPHGLTLLPTPRTNEARGVGIHGAGGPDLRTAVSLLPTPVARDGDGRGEGSPDYWHRRRTNLGRDNGMPLGAAVGLLPTPRATDGTKGGPNQRGSSGDLMLPSAVVQLLPTPIAMDANGARNATANRTAVKSTTTATSWTLSDVAHAERWGEFGPAIRRWETVTGRPAPDPTETGTKGQPRLAPRFVEWLMGPPAGWVTDHVPRNGALQVLGNGVVPQQAAYAYAELLTRVCVPAGAVGDAEVSS